MGTWVSAGVNEANQTHKDRWEKGTQSQVAPFYQSIRPYLWASALTLFSYLTSNLSENTLCATFKFYPESKMCTEVPLSQERVEETQGKIFSTHTH